MDYISNEPESLFCSTIIPTIGRPSLNTAVESVLNQATVDGLNFEILVVNDSSRELPEANWQRSERVTIIETLRHERSVARNAGAAIARGKYLHFLDDDDWLAPDVLLNFWRLAAHSDAGWLYGTTQVVDRQLRPLLQLHHGIRGNGFLQTVAGEWIPLQASLIKAELFFELGGFNPLLTGPEDIDLLRRVTQRSDIDNTPALVANVVMGEAGSTTDYVTHHIGSRWARDKLLDAKGAFSRLRDGAGTSFWHGRLLRIYLTSTVWNLQHKRIFTALSRLLYGLASILLAGSRLLTIDFWRAVVKPYQSESFEMMTEHKPEGVVSISETESRPHHQNQYGDIIYNKRK
jgi:glycosyltransferase involved in cell wall biosynthesis